MTEDLPKAGNSCKYKSSTGEIWDARILTVHKTEMPTVHINVIHGDREILELHSVPWLGIDRGVAQTAFWG